MQLDAPEELEYFPAAQLVQDIVRDAEVYLPAPHSVQLVAAMPEYCPLEQLTQPAEEPRPVRALYVPAGQSVQFRFATRSLY